MDIELTFSSYYPSTDGLYFTASVPLRTDLRLRVTAVEYLVIPPPPTDGTPPHREHLKVSLASLPGHSLLADVTTESTQGTFRVPCHMHTSVRRLPARSKQSDYYVHRIVLCTFPSDMNWLNPLREDPVYCALPEEEQTAAFAAYLEAHRTGVVR